MIELDERGKQCPLPVIEAKKALESAALESGGGVRVIVDNEIAVQNLRKMADHRGFAFSFRQLAEDRFEAELTPGAAGAPAPAKTETAPEAAGAPAPLAAAKNTVVVISSDRMGEPEAELGRILMKGFLYALSRRDEMPDTLLFYNGGARLTCEGSESLEDLQAMEAEGAEILTCGTCLKYQKLEDKLRVGGVTNLYEIAEKLAAADLVIRP